MFEHLADKLAGLPTRPGVYKHLDQNGKVLYVGKAKNLRSRVRSYFQESRPHEGRLRILVNKIVDFEIIVTDTEAEALILENNLIKQLRPRYNVNLKDDKTYPFVCIKNESFPRVFPTRRVRKDGSKYFGPYTDVKNMKLVLQTIRSIFKLRTCSLNLAPEPIAAGKYQTCLEYHIKKCAGPCVGLQTEQSYNNTINQVEKLLNGRTQELVDLLKDEMNRLAGKMEFEEAASLRDQVLALQKYSQKQKVVSRDFMDRDLFAISVDREEAVACGVLFKVREGKIVGRQHKYLRRIEDRAESELMQSFLENHYTETTFFPEEALLNIPTENPEPLETLLADRRGKKVPVKVPQRGDKADLLRMVEANSRLLLQEYKMQQLKRGEEQIPYALKTLQRDLKLKSLPRRIECFDISHLGGTGTVASCVVFINGQAKKKEYRHFKVRETSEGRPDDFAAMREIIARRYRRTEEENGPWPDLVVVDGGKGQLSSGAEALKNIEVYGKFPIVGLAKRLEEVYFPHDKDPVLIPKASASLQLLQRIRNEAHRFAVTFQRKQRQKKLLQTSLLEIPGVGEQRVRKLISTFGSVKRVRQAPIDDLANVVGKRIAENIRTFFDDPGKTERSSDAESQLSDE